MKRTLALLLLVAPLPAQAQDAELPLEVSFRQGLVAPTDKICVTLSATGSVRNLVVQALREGQTRSFKVGAMNDGGTRNLGWVEKPGIYEYGLLLKASAQGKVRQRTVKIKVNYLPAIHMVCRKDQADLQGRSLTFTLNRPADRAELVIRSKDGTVLHRADESYDGAMPGSPLRITWPPLSEDIGRMELKVYDTDSFWVGVAVTPWVIEIPHEKVIFESDRWEVRPSEAPKLDAAIQQIHKVLKEHPSDFRVNLYVAGFTDTVGTTQHNRTLSTNRARAIARYFTQRGVTLPTFYRGYGEEVLAVGTPDQTDEERNRRALYVLAGQPPVISTKVSWGSWQSAR